MEKLCLDCQRPLKGRVDKKFCNDRCRNGFNNLLRIREQQNLREINQILKNNRSILKLKNLSGKAKIKKNSLMQTGFNFAFHTHTYIDSNGETHYFCYEYGYSVLAGEELLLTKEEID